MLQIFGPLNRLGTGVHCYNLAKAYDRLHDTPEDMRQSEQRVAVFPPFGSDQIRDAYTEKWLAARAFFDAHAPSVMIFDIPFFPHFAGHPRVGFAVFETDGFTRIQMAALRSCDSLLVPSKWGQGVLSRHELNSHVVNEGFDPEEFPRKNYKLREAGPPRFIHVGKWEERKGSAQVLYAFADALHSCEAELDMLVDNPFINNWATTAEDILKKRGFFMASGGPNGFLMKRSLLSIRFHRSRPVSLAPAYRRADFGIFPSAGEGWGLPILECVASGTPAITGVWSGQSEFLGEAYPDELRLSGELVPADDGVWFHGDRGSWYVVETRSLEERILWACGEALKEGQGRFDRTPRWGLQVEWTRLFTWKAAAVQLERALKYIPK